MEYFIVALMTLINPETNTQNIYVFTKPHSTIEECKIFAVQNIPVISEQLYINFGPKDKPRLITCVTKEIIEELVAPVSGENI